MRHTTLVRTSVRVGCGALFVTLLVGSDVASANTCYGGDAWVTPPPVGVRAPLNVRPRVTLHATWKTEGFCPPWDERRARQACPKKGVYDLELVPAGSAHGRIAVGRRESISGSIATVELVPEEPLSKSSRYEVHYVERPSNRSDPESERIVLGTFVTGEAVDTTPPTWSSGFVGFERFGLWPGETPAPPPTGRRVITLDMALDCTHEASSSRLPVQPPTTRRGVTTSATPSGWGAPTRPSTTALCLLRTFGGVSFGAPILRVRRSACRMG